MVTKKQTDEILMGPKGALWLIVLTVVIGFMAWSIAQGTRNETRSATNFDATGRTDSRQVDQVQNLNRATDATSSQQIKNDPAALQQTNFEGTRKDAAATVGDQERQK